jgi:histidinol-phosphate aminotransferase
MKAMKIHVSECIQSLIPYVPGKPIEETQRELGLDRVVKLASNENPLGFGQKAQEALQGALGELHRYPDSSGYRLKKALSEHLGVDPTTLVLGNGSNEVIDILIRTLSVPGDAMVTSEAAFVAYHIGGQTHGLAVVETPLTADLRFDLNAMAEAVAHTPRTRFVFIANPNNPTGTYVSEGELRTFLEKMSALPDGGPMVVLDYAYWEYVTASDLPDPLKLQREFPQIFVLRTFSKVHGLAGLRLGYGVGHPDWILELGKVREPFNVNLLALAAGEAALSDLEFVARSKKINDEGMSFWERELKALGVPFWPSQGNFLLIDVMKGFGKSGKEIFEECLREGVIFRPVINYGLPNALRISIGTPEENEIAVLALKKIAQTV